MQYKAGTKIGYLGGGQLARMLSQSAFQMGCHPHIYSQDKNDPAAQVTSFWHQGSLDHAAKIASFLTSVDVVGFESEFMDAKLLSDLQKQTKTKIFPNPKLMGYLQDRLSQKTLFDQYRLTSSPWIVADEKSQILDFFDIHKKGVVFKKRFFGYDGYGTFIIKTKKELGEFLKKHWQPDLFIVEKWIPFKKECAIIVARSQDGSFCHLPLVESFQKQARCDWVQGPIKHRDSDKMIEALKSFLKHLHYVGVMGIEFFVTTKGLIINEVAPRVHNSGHYSLNTNGPSQFDLHNMCLLGLKLPKQIKINSSFAMANLIGQNKTIKLAAVEGLHWYGKTDNRMGRKMGHINAIATNKEDALKMALKNRGKIIL